MNRPLRSFDLAAVAALALLGLVVVLVPVPDPLRAVVLVPLVLIAPGYAIAAALFPPGAVEAEERAVLAFALSVAAWALAGLAVQLAVGLDRGVWLGIALATTLGGTLIAQRRRSLAHGGQRGDRPLHVDRLAVGAVALAVAIAGVAIAIASVGERRELNRADFVALWIAPLADSHAGRGEEEVAIGVQNHEGEDAEYLLRVTREGRTLKEWKVSLADRHYWETRLLTPVERGTLVASLFQGEEMVRRVKIEPEAPV